MDRVALVLAVGLAATLLGIIVGAIINVTEHEPPGFVLGENGTQLLTSAIDGIVGVLVSYVGLRGRRKPPGGDDGDDAGGAP